ncbi:restriction endonuclease subunit S domain-containing protein [Streptomyces sp. DT18]
MTSATVSLGEIISPAAVRRAGTSELPILSMTMRNGLVDQADKFKKRVASADTSAYRVVDRGQLVVGFPIDEGVLSFQDLYDSAMVSPAYEIWDLKQPDLVSCTFLQRFLRSPRALQYYAAKLQGSTARRRSLPRDVFLALPVPVFSFAEQLRIAALLDQVDTLRAKRREAIALHYRLLDSLFRDMFETSTDEKSSLVRLDDVLGRKLRNGISPSSEGSVESCVLTLSAVTRGRFDAGARKVAKFHSDPTVNYSVNRNLFMICRGNGNKELVGRGVFPRVDMFDTAYPDTVLAAPVRTDIVDEVFLEHVWKTPAVREQIEGCARTTNGTYKVNQKTMGSVAFALPKIERQREFAQKVCAVEKTLTAHEAHLAALDELFTSLQHRAFSGTLWEHDATGEAA